MQSRAKIGVIGLAATAAAIGAVALLNRPQQQRGCALPTPVSGAATAFAFGGDRIGDDCWTVPEGMRAFKIEIDPKATAPQKCRGAYKQLAPCLEQRPYGTFLITACLKPAAEPHYGYVFDPTCEWQKGWDQASR